MDLLKLSLCACLILTDSSPHFKARSNIFSTSFLYAKSNSLSGIEFAIMKTSRGSLPVTSLAASFNSFLRSPGFGIRRTTSSKVITVMIVITVIKKKKQKKKTITKLYIRLALTCSFRSRRSARRGKDE